MQKLHPIIDRTTKKTKDMALLFILSTLPVFDQVYDSLDDQSDGSVSVLSNHSTSQPHLKSL